MTFKFLAVCQHLKKCIYIYVCLLKNGKWKVVQFELCQSVPGLQDYDKAVDWFNIEQIYMDYVMFNKKKAFISLYVDQDGCESENQANEKVS